MPKKKDDKTRITIDLSPAAYERLEKLTETSGAETKASVVRFALQVYEYLIQKQREGFGFEAVSKKGEREKLILFTPAE